MSIYKPEDFDKIDHCSFSGWTKQKLADRANALHDERCPAASSVDLRVAHLFDEGGKLKAEIERLRETVEALRVPDQKERELALERLAEKFQDRKLSAVRELQLAKAENAHLSDLLRKALANWCSPTSNWKLEAEAALAGGGGAG